MLEQYECNVSIFLSCQYLLVPWLGCELTQDLKQRKCDSDTDDCFMLTISIEMVQVRIGSVTSLYISALGAAASMNLIQECIVYNCMKNTLLLSTTHHLLWDPGGSKFTVIIVQGRMVFKKRMNLTSIESHLGDKPLFKEGGMLGAGPSHGPSAGRGPK